MIRVRVRVKVRASIKLRFSAMVEGNVRFWVWIRVSVMFRV